MENQNMRKVLVASVVVLAAVAAIAVFFWQSTGFFREKSPSKSPDQQMAEEKNTAKTPPLSQSSPETQKATILKMAASSKQLTVEDKKEIVGALAGNKIKSFNFTDKEIKAILDALNK